MSLKLPYDLEEEILSRVPWNFFAKLRCVCKLWNSLILEERLNKKNLSFHMHSYSGEHRFIFKDSGPTISAVGIEEQKNVVDPPSLIVQDFTLIKAQPCNPIRVYKTVQCDGLLLCVMDNQLLVRNLLLKETTVRKYAVKFCGKTRIYGSGKEAHTQNC